jgi:hypothetical protein
LGGCCRRRLKSAASSAAHSLAFNRLTNLDSCGRRSTSREERFDDGRVPVRARTFARGRLCCR